jgi:hypothetical protein
MITLAGLSSAIYEFHKDIRGQIGNTVSPGPVVARDEVAAMLPQNAVYRPAAHGQQNPNCSVFLACSALQFLAAALLARHEPRQAAST